MLLYYKEETEGKANLCDTAGKEQHGDY